jgi:hypothetical protein
VAQSAARPSGSGAGGIRIVRRVGQLRVGTPPAEHEIEDRALAHLKIVMLAKLRRNEAFAFTMRFEAMQGSGSTTVWIAPTMPLEFRFRSPRQPALNRAWLEALLAESYKTDGLILVDEPDA